MDAETARENEHVIDDDDFTSVSEYDQVSDDDVGSDCSCSTCSTCSTCEICEETGESYDEEEFEIPEIPESNDHHQHRTHCYHDDTDPKKNTNVEEKSNHLHSPVTKYLNGFSTPDEFIIEKFANVMVLKADASHFRNGGNCINGENLKPSQELLLGGNPRKKKVTFLDSSSSSDDVASGGEVVSISSLSDSSTSGSNPDHALPLQNGVYLGHKEDWGEVKNSPSDGEMEREYYRLRNVLKTIDPLKLHMILKHNLKSKDPETINALATLLPKSKFTADTVHCVRCHKEYDPHYGRKRCILYHPEKSVWRVSQNAQGANFKCGLCSKAFRWKGAREYKLSEATELNRGMCFQGVHTPDPEEVSYQPTGAAQNCEDKGCIVFYV